MEEGDNNTVHFENAVLTMSLTVAISQNLNTAASE